MGTVHKVEHRVFQMWLQSGFVNQIEEDVGIGGDLDTRVSFDVEDEAALVDGKVAHPLNLLGELV